MPLDHFVPQVHLRKFYASTLNGKKMYAWRKSNLKTFICDSRDVCRLPDGSTNNYISEARAIEEFLRLVEPRYNSACTAALSGSLVFEDVFSLAGLVAFIVTCSPTAIRLGQSTLASLVETKARLLDENGVFDRSPTKLGNRTLSELLDDQSISVSVDGKYAQAIGIAQVLELTNGFADTIWEFVRNPFEDSPFLTSDFPVVPAPRRGEVALRRFVPLQPTLGAYVTPSGEASRAKPSNLNRFRSIQRVAKRSEVHALNRLIVQSAEDMVFGNTNAKWITRLVQRNATLAVMHTSSRLKTHNGYYTFTSLGIRQRDRN